MERWALLQWGWLCLMSFVSQCTPVCIIWIWIYGGLYLLQVLLLGRVLVCFRFPNNQIPNPRARLWPPFPDRWTDRRTDTDGQMDRQTDRQADRETERQTDTTAFSSQGLLCVITLRRIKLGGKKVSDILEGDLKAVEQLNEHFL